jgi:hypothetical protein
MSFTGWTGGAVELPGDDCWLPDEAGGVVVDLVSAGADGAVVVHSAVQHRIIRIKMTMKLFKGITTFLWQREIHALKSIYSLEYLAICNAFFNVKKVDEPKNTI